MNDNLTKLFEKNLKNNIESKNYSECISLLNKKIIEIFSYKLSKTLKGFTYTSLDLLLESAKGNLSEEELFALELYYQAVRKNLSEEFKLYKLLEIYKIIK